MGKVKIETETETAFHLAIGVSDLQKARDFYAGLLGAKEGRSNLLWVDFNFFGHQLSCHLIKGFVPSIHYNSVDDKSVPIPHFGLIVDFEKFEQFKRLLEKAGTADFVLEPQNRFKDQAGEQRTMFFKDPFGNCIEIKTFVTSGGF